MYVLERIKLKFCKDVKRELLWFFVRCRQTYNLKNNYLLRIIITILKESGKTSHPKVRKKECLKLELKHMLSPNYVSGSQTDSY